MENVTKEQLAEMLDNSEYGGEFPGNEMSELANNSGLVIVYGASDDLVEFDGAIYDEADCYQGGKLLFDSEGFLPDRESVAEEAEDEDDDSILEKWLQRKKNAKQIEALFCENESSGWTFKTKIPHAKFNVMDGDRVQSIGIVFSIKDL